MAALAVAAGLSTATAAELEGFRVETQPAWIKPVDADLNATPPAAQVSQGRYFLLADYQSRLVEAPAEHFVHIAVRALDQTGVEEIASVQVSFDPTYESLAWHRLDVVRDGQRTSRLQSAQFRMLQREEELEYQIFDGSLTLSVVLDDVRSGDIVEYAFTRRGSNPVFGARVFGGFLLQWGVPLQRLHARLQYAADRPLQFALRNTEAQGTTSGVGKLRERSWDLQDLSPVLSEPDAPGWFNPYPRVNWSEYADWTAVEAWARLMFTPPAQPGDEVVKLAEQILAEHDAPAERLHAALRHVQSDIRYLGLEMGPGSHQPTPPAIVLERRFGDCKDKTLLLLTLLDLMHIDAHAALVNTTRRAGLNDMQPSPSAFNHVVVRAEAEGVQYWLDPTRSDQDAPLNLLYQPDFDLALVIDESGSGTRQPRTIGSAPGRTRPGAGPGNMPGYKWHNNSHSNQPVPLFVRGAGADRFARRLHPRRAAPRGPRSQPQW